MMLLSALEKFASFLQIFNFLQFVAAKGGCFPLRTKHSEKKFFYLLWKSMGGPKLTKCGIAAMIQTLPPSLSHSQSWLQ